MRQIQASEAKVHLAQLLDEVERGETVIITRHGHPIARLIPETDRRWADVNEAVEGIAARRRNAPRVTAEEILSAREEGRRS
jgi:prevent-host-death family protein